MTYEQLLTTADQAGLTVKERPLQKHDGLIRGNRIAIRKSIDTQAEKYCVLVTTTPPPETSWNSQLM